MKTIFYLSVFLPCIASADSFCNIENLNKLVKKDKDAILGLLSERRSLEDNLKLRIESREALTYTYELAKKDSDKIKLLQNQANLDAVEAKLKALKICLDVALEGKKIAGSNEAIDCKGSVETSSRKNKDYNQLETQKSEVVKVLEK